jgi:hypothetical protein
MSNNVVRWILIGAAALLIIGLVAYDHGRKHFRGDEQGSHGGQVTTVQIVP